MTFESSLERDWLLVQDFDRQVLEIREQPFTLTYTEAGRTRRYTPDQLVIRAPSPGNRTHEVYEVKPSDVLKRDWKLLRPGFVAANRYCHERGWRFSIVTEREIRASPYLENIRFLRPYRRIADHPTHSGRLMETLQRLGSASPAELMRTTFADPQVQAAALPILWSLMARGMIDAPVRVERLTMTTRLTRAVHAHAR